MKTFQTTQTFIVAITVTFATIEKTWFGAEWSKTEIIKENGDSASSPPRIIACTETDADE